MSKLTFKAEYEDSTITYETYNISLEDILSDFQRFLLGAGFVFDGTIDIVQEEE